LDDVDGRDKPGVTVAAADLTRFIEGDRPEAGRNSQWRVAKWVSSVHQLLGVAKGFSARIIQRLLCGLNRMQYDRFLVADAP
jgi:hypothetical protein